jgi:hypothetical protein
MSYTSKAVVRYHTGQHIKWAGYQILHWSGSQARFLSGTAQVNTSSQLAVRYHPGQHHKHVLYHTLGRSTSQAAAAHAFSAETSLGITVVCPGYKLPPLDTCGRQAHGQLRRDMTTFGYPWASCCVHEMQLGTVDLLGTVIDMFKHRCMATFGRIQLSQPLTPGCPVRICQANQSSASGGDEPHTAARTVRQLHR